MSYDFCGKSTRLGQKRELPWQSLGRSSLSFQIKKKKKERKKEISVVHGVVDSDYIEKLKS